MTHVPIDLDQLNWEPFLRAQEGSGAAAAAGAPGKYFAGVRYQRGFGLLGTVGRFLMPIVKNIGTSAAHEALEAGKNILQDMSQGKTMQEAVTEHGKAGLKKVAGKLQQCGKGARRKRRKRAGPAVTLFPPPPPPSQKGQRRRPRDQLSGEF